MSKFLRRVKSTKGVNGVIVALLLILVGVGAIAGIQKFMTNSSNEVQQSAANSINQITGSNAADGSEDIAIVDVTPQ